MTLFEVPDLRLAFSRMIEAGVLADDLQQVALGFLASMLDRVEQLRVHAGEPGQHAGVVFVALAVAGVNGAQLARIGDLDLMAQPGEQALDPWTVRSDLEGDARSDVSRRVFVATRGGW